MNLRVPIKTNILDVEKIFLTSLDEYININFETTNYMPALYIPKDEPNESISGFWCPIIITSFAS